VGAQTIEICVQNDPRNETANASTVQQCTDDTGGPYCVTDDGSGFCALAATPSAECDVYPAGLCQNNARVACLDGYLIGSAPCQGSSCVMLPEGGAACQ